jgi:hypothetical protein
MAEELLAIFFLTIIPLSSSIGVIYWLNRAISGKKFTAGLFSVISHIYICYFIMILFALLLSCISIRWPILFMGPGVFLYGVPHILFFDPLPDVEVVWTIFIFLSFNLTLTIIISLSYLIKDKGHWYIKFIKYSVFSIIWISSTLYGAWGVFPS